jgi:diadenosine tetraphosphate (Ap4A) HIT family hydrolase
MKRPHHDSHDCPFCTIAADRILAESDYTFTIRDDYPASPGHTLVMTKRHIESLFDITGEEQAEIMAAVRDAKHALEAELQPDGFNIGVNVGVAAGQTVMHAHVHVIPRFKGDVADPRGGIRHCIPGKGAYEVKG